MFASDALIAEYRRQYGDQTILAFSRGKDSISAALAIRDKLDIVPVHYIYVPGMSFVDESLDYYERYLFKRPILRLPHPSLYRHLNNYLFQDPLRAEVISAMRLPEIDFRMMNRMIKEEEGLDQKRAILGAVGIRSADNPIRRMSIKKHGAIRPSTLSWAPVWDWKKADVVGAIEKAGISLPLDYLLWGRTFDGLNAAYLVPLKREFPEDWKRLLEVYPIAEAECFYYELHQKERSVQ